MRLLTTIAGLRSYLEFQGNNRSIGLVPTMGSLHLGHVSLIERAIADTDCAIVSIFVNPLQFAPTEDLTRYPRQPEQDYQLCEQLGVEVVFAPTPETMGMTDDTHTESFLQTTAVIPPSAMTSVLCGAFRQGHFQGVATIVTKLLNIVRPTVAYFGEKDAQQLAIIRRLVADFDLSVEIRACPTIRELSGLAYSSRNQYLTPDEKVKAASLFRSLQQAQQTFYQGEHDSIALIEKVKQELSIVPEIYLQYVEVVHPQTLIFIKKIEDSGLLAIAAYLGSTRLIDNIILRDRQPIIAIDGPAGVGKSTVTRRVAQRLGLMYLDTGAMYRALTWLVLRGGIDLADEVAIAELVTGSRIELIPTVSPDKLTGVKINGEDVTEVIRTPQVTAHVSAISAQKAVRQEMVRQQQQYGKKGGIVVEGRDIGTCVFPDAELKIFMTASPQERARRRFKDLMAQGQAEMDLNQLEQDIQQRDYLDSHRDLSPLAKAADAIEINTDELTIAQVTEKIVQLYRERVKF